MRSRLLLCLSSVVTCASAFAQSAIKPPPQPGYYCKAESRGNFGLIETDLAIYDAGHRQRSSIHWDAGDGFFQNPWITASFFRRSNERFSLANGYISIMRHIWDGQRGDLSRPMKLKLELTIPPRARSQAPQLVGSLQESGGPFHMDLAWLAATEFVHGSSHLSLVARNKQGGIVDKAELDPAIFDRAQPHILAAFEQAERMISAPQKLCIRSDDLDASDIVVTNR